MSARDLLQLLVFLVLLLVLTRPLGIYLDRVFAGKTHLLFRLLSKFENGIYHVCKIDPEEEESWSGYTKSLLIFSAFTCLFTYVCLRLQFYLPLNPQLFGAIKPDLAINATFGYNTNTSWQSFGGETTMSYFSQIVPLLFQFFISPAIAMAAAVAIIRGISRKESKTIGNFWADLFRGILYILFPISFIFAIFLISQGVIQNFLPYQEITTLEGAKQVIAQGPAAVQVVMKLLGTNGGGFFNANSSHPYENPTALCNFVQMLLMILLPSAFVYYLGMQVKNLKHAWSVWTVMFIVFCVGAIICIHCEYLGNPILKKLGAISSINMEGKEVRFGIFNSALFANITTATGCGAINAVLDSFTPLGGVVPLLNIKMGEIIFGGVGSGIYGMLTFIILTIFISGLMIGRTPEYFGKKISIREMKYVMLSIIVPPFFILGLSAIASSNRTALSALGNPGFHGFSEIIYTYTSAIGNNGSTFAGLSTQLPYWNLTLALGMFFGRYFTMIPMLAVAGSLVEKRSHPVGEGTFPAEGPLFITLLIAVILIVGALTYFPVLVLGPIAEHFQMLK